MSVLDHRPRVGRWLFAAAVLVVIHKLRLIAWYAIDDYMGEEG